MPQVRMFTTDRGYRTRYGYRRERRFICHVKARYDYTYDRMSPAFAAFVLRRTFMTMKDCEASFMLDSRYPAFLELFKFNTHHFN